MASRDTMTSNEAKRQRRGRQVAPSVSDLEAQDTDERVPRSTVYNIRLPREELESLEQEASKEGLTIAEYLRQSAAKRPLSSILTQPQFNLSVSTPYFQYGSLVTWSEAQSHVQIQETSCEGSALLTCR